MLEKTAQKMLMIMLSMGCEYGFYPYEFDMVTARMNLKKESKLKTYKAHKFFQVFMTCFAGIRWLQAYNSGHFPLLLRILNTVWFFAYVLTDICFIQFEARRNQIMEFVNHLLQFTQHDFSKGKYQMKSLTYKKDEESYCKKISQLATLGFVMLAANPAVHTLLVDESPCAPHFVSSLVHDCDPLTPLVQKAPFMVIEYYLTTVFFMLWSFNWSMIFLGMVCVILQLRRMIEKIHTSGVTPTLLSYRYTEVFCVVMNNAFFLYMATFPTLLFAIVSILLFGVIRIWHYDPGSNLMFPLCGIRCAFEAITPLGIAGTINDKNKELKWRWKECPVKPSERRYCRQLQKSCNGVRCNASSLYTFENSIVLCCVNNCILLTLNMFLTF